MNPLTKLATSAFKRANALRGPASVVRRRRCLWVLDKTNWIDARLLAHKPFENRQIDRFLTAVQRDTPDVFLDIGANFGLYAILAAVRGEVADVHAFEPVRRNYHQLCAGVFANRIDARVTPHRLALSDQSGEAVLKVAPRSSGVSRIAAAGDTVHDGHFTAEERAPMARLDDVVSFSGRNIMVKLDVEGHELAVLRGMQALLAGNAVRLQIEGFGAAVDALIGALAPLGYVHIGAIEHDQYFLPKDGDQAQWGV